MATKAVIFDLFFTLINPLNTGPGEETEYSVLGMDRKDFEKRNTASYPERACGGIRDPHEMMASILRGLDIPEYLLRRAAEARLERIRKALYNADKKNIALLHTLRSAGYKTALISNADIADIYYWKDSPLHPCFDEVIFSFDTGLLKPDPKIYELALKRLDLGGKDCLYIGDGGHEELHGAKAAGMTTVLTVEYISSLWPEKIEELRLGADYTVGRLGDILKILEQVNQ
ncbi:HAD-IA family hydrolase [Treponema sp. OttesenSCG-928-L16]|nr:HAD-IA family hydrolase [Treponema sp. OttesenSCG-928-L16]